MSEFNKKINIIYASSSGNTELVLEYVSEVLEKYGYENQLMKSEVTSIDVIKENDLFIFGTSTWEHGEINPLFQNLLNKMNDTDMSNKRAGFVGLGDTRYEPVLFCEGMEIIRKSFIDNGGKQIAESLKIDKEPHEKLDTVVKNWVNSLIKQI